MDYIEIINYGEVVGWTLEETDLPKSKDAYNKIREYVTSKQIGPHWIQCSSDINAVPVFPEDAK